MKDNMTPLQRRCLNDYIDERDRALDDGRTSDARMWQDIILHTWESFQARTQGVEQPEYGTDRPTTVSRWCSYTRDGQRLN